MRHFDDDYEIEAIDKCSRALMRLDDKSKIRVVRYLLDKFGLIAEQQTENSKPQEVVNNIIHNQQNNLVLAEPKTTKRLGNPNILNPGQFISLKDILIKNLTKSEPELMIVIGFYNSNFGKSSFRKQSIWDSYRDNNILSENRKKNFGQNLNSLIRKSYFSSITDDEFSISEEGCEYANTILSGNSTTKKRKPRLSKKSKQTKNISEEEVEIENENSEEVDE